MTATLAPDAAPATDGAPECSDTDPAQRDRNDGRKGGGSRVRRIWRGAETDPAWARPALFALLAVTALLYLWDLGSSGWANTYYSAAVQAGTKSWKAFLFGSTDASNFITVDKTPLSLWPMEISARIFGLNSWSVLVPQALMGVATVGVLYAAVKRWFGAGAGLLAGAVCALTPVAALMFRFNNPDASLTLLMTLGAYALTRALEKDSTRWVIAAGAFVGLAFLSKELQAFLVLPAFGITYLIAGPPKLGRRIWHTFLIGISTIVAAGWWVAIVYAWPASSRPYLGGSVTTASVG
jgi:4-amino-4-deoxy-L-arabinose transferase-like glycosyltransferase